jgi:hypothetical protein
MLIRYSSPTNEVEIVAARAEFLDLATRLRSGHGELAGCVDGSVATYERLLSSIVIDETPNRGVFLAATGGGSLSITGDARRLEVLAKNISGFADAGEEDEHIHVEHFPGHFYLEAGSAPTVLAFK